MTATLTMIHVGYAHDRVAGTVVLIQDGDLVAVVDPGMVASQDLIVGPLEAAGVAPASVTDVILSHHHPDHTINIGLFGNARVHDFQATYVGDNWIDAEFDATGRRPLTANVTLLLTPGHTPQDLSTLVLTEEGLIVCTHLWWTADGPFEDPFAPDADVLAASRAAVLALAPELIIPGHGAPYRP